MKLIISLVLWVIGFVISYGFYKIGISELNKKENKDENQAEDKTDINTSIKHFKLTSIINCSALIIATLIPMQFLRWMSLIACGFSFPPVFYDVFYNYLRKTMQSKLRFYLTVVAIINLLLIVNSMSYIYWSYIHKVF